MSQNKKTYTCSDCKKESTNRLNFYQIQSRALRLDSNKTAGRSTKGRVLCEPCVVIELNSIKRA